MAWNHERSTSRLRQEWERIKGAGITVKPMIREMDLSNLSPTDTRLVTGVHLYADIRNLSEILLDPLQRRDDYRRVYRTLHLTRVELRRIVQSVFCGDKIQVQGAKFHGLIFRPYNDPETMAADAVLAGLAMYATLTEAFAQVFDAYPTLVPAIGLELGNCLVANIGLRGDRELISVGNAANAAAKIMSDGQNAITIGKNLYNHLSGDQQGWFSQCGDAYRLDCTTVDDFEGLVRDAGFGWSVESSANKLQQGKDNLPLDDIAIEDVREKIDIERLGPTRAKTCPAATLFIDLDGYTKLVDSLEGDTDELAKAAQLLHLFRYELRQVTETDFDGIALQHQGDRLQALIHSPHHDDEDVMESAVNLCIGQNSSVEDVINADHQLLGKLHVAIGCAFGKALIGRLGVKGDRDPVCIGDATVTAETIQLGMAGNRMGITQEVYNAIRDEEITGHFTWNRTADCYEADGLTYTKIEEAAEANAYRRPRQPATPKGAPSPSEERYLMCGH